MKAYSYVRYGTDNFDKYLHSLFKKAYFGVFHVKNPFTGEKDEFENSISFDSIDEIEFKKYLSFIVDKLNENGVDCDELIRNYKEVEWFISYIKTKQLKNFLLMS